MLDIHFTLAQVATMLRTISERYPDRVGKGSGGCVYATSEGHVLTPVCIIGQMFSDLGLLRFLLRNPNDLNPFDPAMLGACGLGSDFWTDLARFGITADEDAQRFAHAVQRKQDDEYTWSTAYECAVNEYRHEQQDALNTRLDGLFL